MCVHLLKFHFLYFAGIKAEHANSPATEAPLPAMPSGPSPQQLLRDLQQQLFKLFTSKPSEKNPCHMGKSSVQVISFNHLLTTVSLNRRS